VLGDDALHAVGVDRLEVGEVADDFQRAPLARHRPRDELRAGHAGDGLAHGAGAGEGIFDQLLQTWHRQGAFREGEGPFAQSIAWGLRTQDNSSPNTTSPRRERRPAFARAAGWCHEVISAGHRGTLAGSTRASAGSFSTVPAGMAYSGR